MFFEIAWSFSVDSDRSQELIKNFEPFLFSKKSSPVHSKVGPFGAGSHRSGKLAEFV